MAVAQLLIDAGADLDRRDNDGYTVMHKAEQPGQKPAADVLRAAGARR